ncbi:HlyD family secretion protein [Aeromonas veronii]|uniref:Efflux transporter, RND family, MFP subunit n=1 Tax=Aeromonas veronii AMC34 TaxID=1073383 RepID=K1JLT3_AERVE|nr:MULTISPECIES: HlyD family secretion protein [Aeromonas]EKB20274.1 efflux transporter, RND family, MFP subunit [Aeromonas veronii AMC34]EKP0295677.1 HlyD family secretion protein [Aeromonas veronii]KAB0663741.1 HlyD family secretion protein [Aeromonas veronii]KAJ8742805.1 HlyD family secretion protein [Aeromonas veronii]MBA2799432.1 HlyD family secretion protein [Aeromonas veronii]
MDLLLILTYTALCVAIFKIFRIPLNKWTVPTAALGGVVLIGTLIMLMNYNHPYSEMARNYYLSTPIVPLVKGRVVEVPVQANQPVKKGDVLFRLDDEPFRLKVESLSARLDANKDQLKSIDARLRSAKLDRDRASDLMRRGVGKQRDLDVTQASVDEIAAQMDQQRATLEDLQAQLDEAKYQLAQTVVYAPSDGHVVQLALRPGMIATPFMYRPVMTFIHKDETAYVGWFWQNSMQRLAVGDEAEVVIDGIPGKIFKGKVTAVIPAIAAGNVQANAMLLDQNSAIRPGRMPVLISITDPEWAKYQVIAGASGQAAVYTEYFHHVSVMRKVLLRMASWMNYLFPFH